MKERRRGPARGSAAPRLAAGGGILLLDGAPWFMRAGELQYFRVERRLWERSLARLRGLGFNAITTYVPWTWHEPSPGHYDFSGATDPRRDLLGFLRACQAEGLPVVVRPGPFIYAEYEGFGHPLWLEETITAAMARGPGGKPVRSDFWAAYSLGHPDYRAAVRRWYETLAAILADLWNDPVIAWQLDNETGFLYANGLGKWDFNPDTVQRFRAWLRAEYASIASLNAAWGSSYRGFDSIRPPQRQLRRGLSEEWQRFLESWIEDYLFWLRATAEEAGVPVPFAHNDSANFMPPTNPGGKAAAGFADLYGFDLYIKTSGAELPVDYPWGSACAPAFYRAVTPEDKPLLCWELGAGWFDPRARLSDDAFLQNILGCLAHGLKGFSLYTVQDAVEATGHAYGYQTVLDRQARPGPRHGAAGKVLDFISRHEVELLAARPQRSEPTVGFAFHYPDFRFRPEDYLPLIGLQDPPRMLALVLAHFGVYAALTAAGYSPNLRLIDLQGASAQDLAACRAIVMPSKGNLSAETYGLLRGYVEQGGHLVTTGRPAAHDLLGRPLDTGELYPHVHAYPAEKLDYLGRLPMMLHLAREWLLKYRLVQRKRLQAHHPTSMHLIDLAEPLSVLMHGPQAAARLDTRDGTSVRGDFMVTHFGGTGTALLRHRGRVAGYTVRAGHGSSTVVGSQPGGSYFTPRYYRLSADDRAGVRGFWRDLLTDLGAPPALEITSDLDVEVQVRTAGAGRLLFIVNRLPTPQHGAIRLDGHTRQAVQLFEYRGSRVEPGAQGALQVDLRPLDVVIARLE